MTPSTLTPATAAIQKGCLLLKKMEATLMCVMPEEQFKAFLNKAKDDQSLQDQLKRASSQEEVITLARETGYGIPADFIKTKSKLSEEELESIDSGNCLAAT